MAVVNGNGEAPKLRLTLQQGMAFHALQRTVAGMRGDAQLLQDFGEKEIAKVFLGCAALMEGATEKYLQDTQRSIIPIGGALVRP